MGTSTEELKVLGTYWYVQFQNEAGHWSTMKVWARTMPQAIAKARDEYLLANNYRLAEADRHMKKAGLWGAD